VPTSIKDSFGMTGAYLAQTLEECRTKGLEPFFLTTSLGTTSTCAVDDFAGVASTLKTYSPPGPGEVWVHVDAAYAGAALVCPEFHHHTSSFGDFHSFDMNMHKWLLTNFDASCLFIKRRKDLLDALSITPSYLRNEFSESGLVTDYRDWQIPLGRRFRALKIWFVLRMYGVVGLQSHIRKHVKYGKVFYDLIASRPDLFEVISGPNFALTVFSIKSMNGHTDDKLTKEVYELINTRGEVYLTSTVVAGIYAIRVVAANPLTEEKHLHKVFDILVRTTMEVSSAKSFNDATRKS